MGTEIVSFQTQHVKRSRQRREQTANVSIEFLPIAYWLLSIANCILPSTKNPGPSIFPRDQKVAEKTSLSFFLLSEQLVPHSARVHLNLK